MTNIDRDIEETRRTLHAQLALKHLTERLRQEQPTMESFEPCPFCAWPVSRVAYCCERCGWKVSA